MKKSNWKPYVLFIALTEAVGGLAGLLTVSGIRAYESVPKSNFTPPTIVFPIVWVILFALMGIGAARIWLTEPSSQRSGSLFIFALQLIFNFFWSLLFFNLQAFGFSLLWLVVLWMLILLMILSYRQIDKPAALLQIPYFLWVSFAGYLNLTTWILNR